jgi:hypothetical protein
VITLEPWEGVAEEMQVLHRDRVIEPELGAQGSVGCVRRAVTEDGHRLFRRRGRGGCFVTLRIDNPYLESEPLIAHPLVCVMS